MIRCLSVRQPYAWAIIHAGKDVENRSRRCRVRGRVLIHASRGTGTLAQFQASFDRVCQALGGGFTYPSREHRGGIIGSVEIVDSDIRSDSPWFDGPWGWFLRNPKPIEFIPCTGRLGFFPAPEYVARILAQRGGTVNTPNRKIRREAVRALPRQGDELTAFLEVDLRTAPYVPGLVRAFRGSQVSAQLYRASSTNGLVAFRISVRRHDGARLREHWRTMMRIKEIVCPGLAAFEAYPGCVADVTDDAPMWHLWVLGSTIRLGVGLGGRES